MRSHAKKVSQGTATLVDVREYDEWLADKAEEAFHLPLSGLIAGNLPPFEKDHTILLHCRSGARSEQARHILLSLGYTNVVNVGGLEDWRRLIASSKE